MVRGRKPWDHLSAVDLKSLQEHRLRQLLRKQVIPFSPFYRRLFEREGIQAESIRTLDDLKRLPFTSKADIMVSEENPDGPRSLILRPNEELVREHLPKLDQVRLLGRKLVFGKEHLRRSLLQEYNPCTVLFTTGRSTGSIPFFLTLHDQDILHECGRRICEVVGINADQDRVFNLFPYAPHLAFWQTYYCGIASGTLTLNTGGGRVMGTERIIGAIEKMKPTTLVAMPGYFYHLLRRIVAEGRDLSSVNKLALGGENVPAGFKRKVVDLMEQAGAADVKVASVLGFTEARMCWAECTGDRRTGFHTYPDLGLFEIVDGEGNPLPPGETGELVYTSLDGRGSVLMRYRTGDIVEGGIVTEPCPGCGRTVPRIMSDIHRISNVKSLDIGKVKGTLVNLNALSEAFSGDLEIEEWQLEIRKHDDDPFENDEIVLYCAVRGHEDPAEFERRIQTMVNERCEIHLNEICVEKLASLLTRIGMEELTKEVRVLDRRPETTASCPGTPS